MTARMYAQYADKPKAVAWYGIVPSIANQITTAATLVRLSYDIDTNTREQLNVIGRIVVVGATWETVASDITNLPIGEVSPHGYGKSQYGAASYNTAYTSENYIDGIYRTLIRSKIAKNVTDASTNGIIRSLQFIVGGNRVNVTDYEDMTMDIIFEKSLTIGELYALRNFDIIPRPQSVSVRGILVLDDTTFFGAEDAQFGGVDDQFGFYFEGF